MCIILICYIREHIQDGGRRNGCKVLAELWSPPSGPGNENDYGRGREAYKSFQIALIIGADKPLATTKTLPSHRSAGRHSIPNCSFCLSLGDFKDGQC